MTARIYLPARNAMQAGQAKDQWVLEFEPESPRQSEPLMGWTASSDMRSQVRLRFASKDEAIAYATRAGLAYRVEAPKPRDPQIRVLFRQFSSRPPDPVVALIGRRPAGSVAQLDRAAAF